MKVLIIGLYNKLGGIEKCIYDYVSHMDLNGVSVGFVGAPEHIWFEEEFKRLGCIVHPTCERKNIIRYFFDLCKIITENDYDIVHINMLSCANIVPLLAARKCGVKIICHSHNSLIPSGSVRFLIKKILHLFNRYSVKKNDVIKLSCSLDAGKFMFGKKLFTVLANAIDTKSFSFDENIRITKRMELGIPENAVVIGLVGRFEYQKNHEFAIQVFTEFQKSHTESFLLLIGTGSLLKACKKQAQELGIEQNVIFCGQQNDIPPYLFAMDVFLFPSRFEGLGIVGVEAQCAGLPVIASKNIASEMAQTDLVAWCDLSSPMSEWTSAIESRLSQIPLRRGYAKELTLRGFDISTQSQNLRKIYESCMEASK